MAKGDHFLVYFYKKNSRMQTFDDLANTLSALILTWHFYFGRFFMSVRVGSFSFASSGSKTHFVRSCLTRLIQPFLTEKPFIPTRNAVRTSTETQHK